MLVNEGQAGVGDLTHVPLGYVLSSDSVGVRASVSVGVRVSVSVRDFANVSVGKCECVCESWGSSSCR